MKYYRLLLLVAACSVMSTPVSFARIVKIKIAIYNYSSHSCILGKADTNYGHPPHHLKGQKIRAARHPHANPYAFTDRGQKTFVFQRSWKQIINKKRDFYVNLPVTCGKDSFKVKATFKNKTADFRLADEDTQEVRLEPHKVFSNLFTVSVSDATSD